MERFFSGKYYFLATASLFESFYRGSDGIFRNTAFNGNFVYNLLTGKEWVLSPNSSVYVDIKTTWAGGRRYTPVDIEASRKSKLAMATVYLENMAWEEQYPDYFKTDVKIGFRLNKYKVAQVFELSAENITNHTNPYYRSYSRTRDEVINTPQMGFLPLAKYRILFLSVDNSVLPAKYVYLQVISAYVYLFYYF